LKFKHPVGIITKNALILRDLDLLKRLSQDDLVNVHVSITSLSEETRRILEPRTVSIKKRLEVVKTLSENGIPVNAMFAPIIPGINSHEVMALAKIAAEHGATTCGFTMIRLNGAIGEIFTDWIKTSMPDRAEKVLNHIAACHGGSLNDSRFGTRMKGEGKIAEHIHGLMRLAKQKYFKNKKMPELNTDLHELHKCGQLRLF
jgi:DNA repair photolyase